MKMTTDELQKLLDTANDTNSWNANSALARLHRETIELARRVIAAEKLAEALVRIDDASNHYAHQSARNLARTALAEWEASK